MVIHVKGFGKIRSADINIGSLTLFIGENNSGKTYLMQLIYQVLDSLTDLKGISKYLEENLTQIDSSNFKKINIALNKWLQANRNKIVKDIFLCAVPIKELGVDLDEIDGKYTLEDTPDITATAGAADSYKIKYNGKRKSTEFFCVINSTESNKIDSFVSSVVRQIVSNHCNCASSSLFIPASRSGLMLVYRNVFASRGRQALTEITEKRTNNSLGLTRPVYDFLEFLQTYCFDSRDNKLKKEIVDFISKNIIDGIFDISSNAILYKTSNSNEYFPAHLSSSMVNELAPIVMALTNLGEYRYIFYDEIETCLHPLKQIEMARLVVRLVNSNYKMLISTHSDTMAIALNNLILLSRSKNKDTKAKTLGYNKDDFFQKNDIHVYQFKCEKGKTNVTEVEMYPNINIGYDFELFNQSNDKLYNDARIVMEDTDE